MNVLSRINSTCVLVRVVRLGKNFERVTLEISICLASSCSTSFLIMRNGSKFSMFISYHRNICCTFSGCMTLLICGCVVSWSHLQFCSILKWSCKEERGEMHSLSFFLPHQSRENTKISYFLLLVWYINTVRGFQFGSQNGITRKHFVWASKVCYEIKLVCLRKRAEKSRYQKIDNSNLLKIHKNLGKNGPKWMSIGEEYYLFLINCFCTAPVPIFNSYLFVGWE